MKDNNLYEKYDSCYGSVVTTCRQGAFVVLDNDEEAFAFKFGNLRKGTKVFCTVLKEATEFKKKLVSIDSVIYGDDIAA